MKLTPGKQKGLKAVSNSRDVIAAAAMDQRGSLKSAIAKDKGVDKSAVTAQMLEEFKTAVVKVLTPHASAILLDPEYGLPAALARSKNAGLLLAYENSGYDNTRPGRLPDLLDIWSVRRLVAAGADCIKILLYYTPFDPPDVNEIKHAWVERIGAECTAADVPFFLELVGYEEGGGREGNRLRAQEARHRREKHGGIFEAPVRRGHSQGRSSRSTWRSSPAPKPARANPPTRATRPRSISCKRRHCREEAVHLSFGRREQRRVSAKRSSLPPNPA